MACEVPAFIAFTGVDRIEIRKDLVALSARYPIEWGILIDDEREGNPLFPSAGVRRQLVDGVGLRWAAHVCGTLARRIASAPRLARLDLAGYQRVQVNHSRHGSAEEEVHNCALFGRGSGLRTVLQCPGAFPGDERVDWLFDTSFGEGAAQSAWPLLPPRGPFCGFSGGLNPHNVRDVLEQIAAPVGSLYWIDMESGVRTDGWLDVAKCRAVCEAVYR